MKFRKLTLALFAVLALSLSMLGVASAASRGQDAPADTTNAETQLHPGGAYLGLEVTKLTNIIRRILGLPDEVDGLVVMGSHPGSPAAEAGLHRADVMLSIDGHVLVEPSQLKRFLNSKAPGDVIEVVYFRDGERHAVSITLGEMPAPQPRPEWLKKLHVFLRAFPNTVDATLRLLDDDGVVKTFVITPGTVLRISDTQIGVEDRVGETHVYDIVDDTVFYARYHRIRPGVVQPGMEVAVLTVDGTLRAVVVTGRGDTTEPTPEVDAALDTDEIADANDPQVDARGQIVAEFESFLGEARQQADEPKDGRDAADRTERAAKLRAQLDERIAKLREHFADRFAKLQTRLDERNAKVQAHITEREAQIKERAAEQQSEIKERLTERETKLREQLDQREAKLRERLQNAGEQPNDSTASDDQDQAA